MHGSVALYGAFILGLAALGFGISGLMEPDPAAGSLRAAGGVAVYLLSWAGGLWSLARTG